MEINGTEYWGEYELSLEELEALPTLTQGQADDLKIESDTERVWLSRCTVEDGEPWNNKVTVERLIAGSWVEVEHWEAVSSSPERARLEELRTELRAERISWGELAELQSLAEHIDPDDAELLEAAGVPENEDDYPYDSFTLTLELGNDAMREPEHIADALRRVAQMIENSHGADGSIMDNNGNTVGRFETT